MESPKLAPTQPRARNFSGKKSKEGGKCLVTGGAGFIGSHVAEALLRTGYHVVCLDNLKGGRLENVPPGAAFVRGDVNDDSLLAALFTEFRFEYVFHFAAFAAEGLSHFVRAFAFRNNQCGTATLINAAVNKGSVRAFVFASSAAVYGKTRGELTERTAPNPCDPYGITKMASELDLRTSGAFFGLPYIIFRLHNVYGERQNFADPFRNVVGIFMRQMLEGKKLTIFGDGRQSRQFTYVSGVAEIIAKAIDRPKMYGEVFNVGSDKAYSIFELAQALCGVVGKKLDAESLPARDEAAHPVCSHAKIRRFFADFNADIRLETGLQRMWKWAASAPPYESNNRLSIEILQNLPVRWQKEIVVPSGSISIHKTHFQTPPHEQSFGELRESRRR